MSKGGELLVGEWHPRAQVLHGHGFQRLADGSWYRGGFFRGRWHGDGSRRLPDGTVLRGRFRMGSLEEGEARYADGRRYRGEFRANAPHAGRAVLVYPNGDRYVGPFAAGRMHGAGEMISHPRNGGGRRRGVWAKGVLERWVADSVSQSSTEVFVQLMSAPDALRSPLAAMVARQLPSLPGGVDAQDPRVQRIVRQIAAGTEHLGLEQEEAAEQDLERLLGPARAARARADRMQERLRSAESAVASQRLSASRLAAEMEQAHERFQQQEDRIEFYWKYEVEVRLACCGWRLVGSGLGGPGGATRSSRPRPNSVDWNRTCWPPRTASCA